MIYICIPTHNEQQTVGVVLWKLRQVLTDFPREYQLLVADDASTDKTAEVLEPYTRVLPLTVIRSDTRQGTAASLEMLLREAVRRSEYPKRDAIVTLQADFSDEPDDLVPLIKRLEAGADVAIGNKISPARETRTRRYSRMLARFFMRRQKWPEAVVTPFDGYRAYRLYSIRRAIESQTGRRLLRYDSWAGNAELLRAVLPHARRVDAVDVDDRTDRLQRPRREKPFASAMQVRTMAGGAEPHGLVGVQELDRIAQTASRSRERAAVTARSLQNERPAGARTNGSRTRDRRPASEARPARTRSQAGGTRSQAGGTGSQAGSTRSQAGATRSATSEGGEQSRQSGRSRSRTQADARSRSAAPTDGATPPEGRPQSRKPQGEGRRRKPRTEQAAAAADVDSTALVAEGSVAPEAATKPKRKRRRRRKSGQAGAGSAETGQPEDGADTREAGAAEPVRSADESPAAARDAGDTEGGSEGDQAGQATGEKKRRRRGGRRGGRGRRRARPEDAGEGGEAAAHGTIDAAVSAPVEQAAGQPAARVEND